MKKYQIIYADPPWQYNKRKNINTKFGGGAMRHYPTMSYKELVNMKPMIDNWADDNCILFLWTTGPKLDIGINLIKDWGFRYCTIGFVWIKTSASGNLLKLPGYYTASNVELVLIGAKGSLQPENKMILQPLIEKRQDKKHSEKPEEIRNRISSMYPSSNKIELFARKHFPQWDVWGNEV